MICSNVQSIFLLLYKLRMKDTNLLCTLQFPSEDLIPNYWTQEFFREEHRLLTDDRSFAGDESPQAVASSSSSTFHERPNDRPPMSTNAKFRFARIITDGLASLAANCGTRQYEERMSSLSRLADSWKDQDDTIICHRQQVLVGTQSK